MSEPGSAASSSAARPPLLHRLSSKLVRPIIAAVALGAAGNVVLGWIAARGSDLRAAELLGRPLFYLAMLLAFLPWVTHSGRLRVWTKFLKRPLALPDVLRIVFGNDIGSAITPTAAGGGYAKLGMLVERGYPAGTAASLMILGSIEDYTFFVVAVPTALLLLGPDRLPIVQHVLSWLGGNLALPTMVACLAICALILYRRPIIGRLGRRWHDFADVFRLIVKRGKGRFALTVALTTAHWICRYMSTAVLLTSLGVSLDPLIVFVLQWVIFTAALAIPTPGAMVGVEASFYVVYQGLIPDSILPAAVAAWRLLTFYAPLAVAALGFTLLQRGWQPLPLRAPSPSA